MSGQIIDLRDEGYHGPIQGEGRFLVMSRFPTLGGLAYRWTGQHYETLEQAEAMCHTLALATGGHFYVHEAGW